MRIEFAASAARHGISQERVRRVIARCPEPLYPPAADPDALDLVLFLAPDPNGVPLEVVAVELNSGHLLVIHAMRLRRKYEGEYLRVMEERW
jgi:hypothetical protein